MDNDSELSRRKFLWRLLFSLTGLISLLVGIPVIGSILSPLFQKKDKNSIPIAWLEDLQSNEPMEINFNHYKQDAWFRSNVKQSVYVLRTDPKDYRVYSAECTHLGCSVRWSNEQRKFLCPCHGGEYDRQGNVIAGPPPKSLTQYKTKIENGRLFIIDI